MSKHVASVSWKRKADEAFTDNKYSRAHIWRFDGGVEVPGSPSPSVVPAPYSDPAGVDPEEAFVASLSSCHMLTYLWLAGKKGIVVDSYDDDAEGRMGKNAEGRIAVTRVTLRPRVTYAGQAPDRAAEEALHHEAHEQCFVANSVKTEIVTELV